MIRQPVSRAQLRAEIARSLPFDCLGTLDRLFGVRVTTRNWNTIIAIGKVLDNGAMYGHRARVRVK